MLGGEKWNLKIMNDPLFIFIVLLFFLATYGLARNILAGIQNVVSDFEESFRANNRKAVKDTPVLHPERIRKAIATGVFEGARRKIPCEEEALEVSNLLLNRIADTY
jgi:hypothetical protein